MKETNETRLTLKKVTIQHLVSLDMAEQQAVKGGSDSTQEGITNSPIYCSP